MKLFKSAQEENKYIEGNKNKTNQSIDREKRETSSQFFFDGDSVFVSTSCNF